MCEEAEAQAEIKLMIFSVSQCELKINFFLLDIVAFMTARTIYIFTVLSLLLSNNILVMIQMTACIESYLCSLFSSVAKLVFAQITHLLTIQV